LHYVTVDPMKKPKDVADLAARLTAGATTPLQVVTPAVPPEPAPTAEPPSAPKRGSVSVFLRLPSALHARVADIATQRTKETGKGVTVQQVILELLERGL
jgi:hypothetical protein